MIVWDFLEMGKSHFVALLHVVSFVFIFLPFFNGGLAMATGTPDGSESWGYVEVRPSKIH